MSMTKIVLDSNPVAKGNCPLFKLQLCDCRKCTEQGGNMILHFETCPYCTINEKPKIQSYI